MTRWLVRLLALFLGGLFLWAALVARARGEDALAGWVFSAGFVVAFAPWLYGRAEA